MAKESFMLVSLKGDKAKKLAQVMANPTCTKILDHLAGKDATESQIAKDLSIPFSTVHYNLQQLVEAKLVVVDEFHYSEKGREMNHYKLANKYIIIAPQEDNPGLLEKLKKFIPLTLITLGAAAVIKVMQLFTGSMSAGTSQASLMSAPLAAPMAKAAIAPAADQAAGAAPRLMAAIAPAVNETVNETLNSTVNEAANSGAQAGARVVTQSSPSIPWWQSPTIDYFIAGAFFVLVVLIILEIINHWREKR